MNKGIMSIFAIFVIGLIVFASAVSAYRGDYLVKGPDYDEERHQEMEEAFEDLDYAKWYELMTENGRGSRVLEKVTEENFEKFVEAHNAGIAGDYETANEIRAELGLNNGLRNGTGYKQSLGGNLRKGMGQCTGRI
ncbi:MAG: hypothetical protein AB7V77_04345 [Candidatus Woesearchaeota archaeon]